MRTIVLVIVGLSLACSDVAPPPPPPTPNSTPEAQAGPVPRDLPARFTLTLDREYGYWKFRRCRLSVVVFEGKGTAQAFCERADGSRSEGRRELAPDETARLVSLARGADLYGASHTGEDSTPNDGVFETLRVRNNENARTVVLVTSGNRTFDEHASRRDLLDLLRRTEKQMAELVR